MELKPADGVELFLIEDQGVLFSESAQKLYHLNTVAAFIWCLLEDGEDESQMVSSLSEQFSLDSEVAASYLEQSLELFNELGVLVGSESPTAADASRDQTGGQEALQTGFVFPFVTQYRLLNSIIRLECTSSISVELVAPVLKHLEVDGGDDPTVRIQVVEQGGACRIYRDGELQLECDSLNKLAPLVKGLVWQTALVQHDFFLDLHAGVVSDGKQCFLFPAAPGSGKSTLTAVLAKSGFEFYSDEVALIQDESMWVEPVPLALCVKDTGVDVLKSYYPALPQQEMHLRGDGKRVRYLAPELGEAARSGVARPVGAIIFPRYQPDSPAGITRLAQMEALQMLLQECLVVDSHLDSTKVRALLDWVAGLPCYRLSISGLDQAAAAVVELSASL